MAGESVDFRPLEDLLGHVFRNRSLLQEALTHASAKEAHNERLEFLGDAVLNLVVVDLLFSHFQNAREGELTERKSRLVSRATLEKTAQQMGLAEWVEIGPSLAEVTPSVLGNALEALLGAIYLDTLVPNRLSHCTEVVRAWLKEPWNHLVDDRLLPGVKSRLQHWAQKEKGTLPEYRVKDSFDHPTTHAFLVTARVGKREFPEAWGSTKKEAERWAAWEALRVLNDHAN